MQDTAPSGVHMAAMQQEGSGLDGLVPDLAAAERLVKLCEAVLSQKAASEPAGDGSASPQRGRQQQAPAAAIAPASPPHTHCTRSSDALELQPWQRQLRRLATSPPPPSRRGGVSAQRRGRGRLRARDPAHRAAARPSGARAASMRSGAHDSTSGQESVESTRERERVTGLSMYARLQRAGERRTAVALRADRLASSRATALAAGAARARGARGMASRDGGASGAADDSSSVTCVAWQAPTRDDAPPRAPLAHCTSASKHGGPARGTGAGAAPEPLTPAAVQPHRSAALSAWPTPAEHSEAANALDRSLRASNSGHRVALPSGSVARRAAVPAAVKREAASLRCAAGLEVCDSAPPPAQRRCTDEHSVNKRTARFIWPFALHQQIGDGERAQLRSSAVLHAATEPASDPGACDASAPDAQRPHVAAAGAQRAHWHPHTIPAFQCVERLSGFHPLAVDSASGHAGAPVAAASVAAALTNALAAAATRLPAYDSDMEGREDRDLDVLERQAFAALEYCASRQRSRPSCCRERARAPLP
jgi:hypothetical protein